MLYVPPTNTPLPRPAAPRTILTTEAEVRIAAVAVAASARRVLSIYAHNLDSPILEYTPFLQALKSLVLQSRFARVRLLVMRPGRVMYHQHAFIVLARKLTSYIQIRHAPPSVPCDPSSFVVADEHATLYRLQHDRWEGICDLEDVAVARAHRERFDEAWHASALPRPRQRPREAAARR